MSRILVTGASGKQGSRVVDALLEAKQSTVYALTRSIDSPAAKKLEARGVHLVKGSFTDPEGLVKALKQVDAAFMMTIPPSMDIPGAKEEERQGKLFVDCAKEAGLKYLVFTSVGDADQSTGVPHFESKFQIEEHLRASGLKHTILRPVAFYDNLPRRSSLQSFFVLGLFDAALNGKRLKYISNTDIGKIAARALQDPESYSGRIIELAGDELSCDEVLNCYARVQGYRPWKAYVPSIMVNLLPYDFKTMLWYFAEHGYKADIKALKAEFPDLLSFEDWLREGSSTA